MNHPAIFRVGSQVSFTYNSEPTGVPGKGEFPTRFAPEAFTAQLWKVVPLKFNGEAIGSARVIAAEVSEDGYSVEFTYEITELGGQSDPAVPVKFHGKFDDPEEGLSHA
jgi:hypothetical protein